MPQPLSADALIQKIATLEKELAKSRAAEARLQKILSNYKSLFESSDDYILISDHEAKPVMWNSAYARIIKMSLGVDVKPGIQTRSLLADKTMVAWLNKQRDRVLGGETFREELSYNFGNGDIRYFELSYCPIIEQDEIKGFSEMTRDITARKLAENALKESEGKYRLLFERMPNGIAYFEAICDDAGNLCDARYIDMNTVYQLYTGLIRDRAIGRTVLEILPGTQKSWFDTLNITIQKGKPLRFEMYHQGTQKHYSISAYSPQKNHLVLMFRDVSRQKETEIALRESEQRFRALFDQAEDAICVCDFDGCIRDVNPAACLRLGYEKSEMLALRAIDIADDEETARHLEELKQGSNIVFETRHRRKNGSLFPVEVSLSLIHSGGAQLILYMARDISKRRQTEQEKLEMQEKRNRSKKMEAMGLMAGGVAHDLNNLLSSVISYPELLLMNPLFPDNFRRSVERIKEGGLRAAAIVSDLLTIARGVASRKEIANINEIISAYLNSFEHLEMLETRPDIFIEQSLEPHLYNIRCSPVHIRKVLMNLVMNAIESVKSAGEIAISTRNQYLDKPVQGYDDVRAGAYAVLSVADNGGGISPEDMEHIFEPFYSKKKMGRSGTGLGLTVVWNTVEDHQGYIHVSSGTNGARFEVYFPASGMAVTDTAHSVDRISIKGSGQRILVVDDEESQREIARQILTELGYQVETVESGEKALAYLQANAVDIIVLDMIMQTGMNGRQTYEEILKVRPGQKAIIASGFAESADVREAQRLGAGAFIKKPYTIDQISVAIKGELLK